MANKNHTPRSNDRVRARFMLVDVEGSSQDLQQIAQAFAHAVKATQPAMTAVSSLPAPTPVRAIPGTMENNGQDRTALDAEASLEPIPEEAEAKVQSSKSQNGTKRKYRTPSVIEDLDLTSGDKPFKEYMEEQAPKEDSKRYLAITQWLKEQRNITEVGADHIYTCYRTLGMNVPEDVLGVFHGLKKRGWVSKGSKRGRFKITHVGENQLNPMKPKE